MEIDVHECSNEMTLTEDYLIQYTAHISKSLAHISKSLVSLKRSLSSQDRESVFVAVDFCQRLIIGG